jgi:hypothetical protein
VLPLELSIDNNNNNNNKFVLTVTNPRISSLGYVLTYLCFFFVLSFLLSFQIYPGHEVGGISGGE